MSKRKTLNLPKLLEVKLNDFSLYSRMPNIELVIGDGVFCLAGANGLGKSTFLNAVNYALTGIVRNPAQKFTSADEYFKLERNKAYSADYFQGRISEDDRETASISIKMQVGKHIFNITRYVFHPDELEKLLITKSSGESILDGIDHSAEKRNELYQQHLSKEIGLDSFQQFVFLQHFVFTFDESRYLLLWNQDAVNTAMFLSLGGDDLSIVQRSEKIKRDMEKAGSRARNLQYQASNLRADIKKLQDALGVKTNTEDLEQLAKSHKSLQNTLDLTELQVDKKRKHLSDIQLKWSEINSELASLQINYSREFNSRVQRRARVELHPVVSSSLSDHKCAVCGSQNTKSIDVIKVKVENNTCPLCESPLPAATEDKLSIEKLREIDKQIAKCKNKSRNYKRP